MRLARAQGVRVGLFRLLTLWPFPEAALSALSRRVRHLVVPEMNLGQLALEVERVAQGCCPVHRVNKVTGEPIPPEQILETLVALR